MTATVSPLAAPTAKPAQSWLRWLAYAFALALVVYSVEWMRHPPYAGVMGPGMSVRADSAGVLEVTSVTPGGSAGRAGVRAGDRVTAVMGQPAPDFRVFYRDLVLASPGSAVPMTIERGGAEHAVTMSIGPPPGRAPGGNRILIMVLTVLRFFPVAFVAVAVFVLMLRWDARDAWLMALVFAGVTASAPLNEAQAPASLRGFMVAFQVAMSGALGAYLLYFFSVFPARSPLDRHVPWLKKAGLWISLAVVLPLGVLALVANGSLLIRELAARVGPSFGHVAGIVSLAFFVLGIAALAWNSLRGESAAARRKIRVIFWGTVAALVPNLVLGAVVVAFRQRPIGWLQLVGVFSLFALPLSFAYAVIKHQVLDVPVLLRRSARYVLVQRGFVLLTVLLSIAAALGFATLLVRLLHANLAAPETMTFAVAFGSALAWGGARVVRGVTTRIDRAFFRSAYDARQILEYLSQMAASIGNREDLAELLRREIEKALHPRALAVYLQAADGRLRSFDAPESLRVLPRGLPLLRRLEQHAGPWLASETAPLSDDLVEPVAALNGECFVPMIERGGGIIGLLVLGARLSDEPYSNEDRRLLASVAGQAALSLRGIKLAEQMAVRMETERRAAVEMQIARQVQERLLPQRRPETAGLEFAGRCVQAKDVGGDYYDFLSLDRDTLAVVLADIAGKGISSALLMANLQANLRSHHAMARNDIAGLLTLVNTLFYESTAPENYATSFLATWHAGGRRLQYANCGHNPPLLLRANSIERLHATATVLGMFPDWVCTVEDLTLAPGDLLAIYSDGVTEARSENDEEFGEARLIAAIQEARGADAATILDHLISRVQEFSGSEQEDDVTLIVIRVV
jgi:sigma-B regulation protein RsbU (phosphoserine phosphatase)